jgi:hypothetical protein
MTASIRIGPRVVIASTTTAAAASANVPSHTHPKSTRSAGRNHSLHTSPSVR